MSRQIVDRSALFAQYNRARAKASGLDRGRCNRALGLVQSGKVKLLSTGQAAGGSNGIAYLADGNSCTCPDFVHRVSRDWKTHGSSCKHMIARWFLLRVEQGQAASAPVAQPAPTLETLVADVWGGAA